MKKIYRISRAEDFRRIFRYGKRVQSPFFQITALNNGLSHARFAFIAPKTVSKKAVVRNALRRRAGEWVRKRPGLLSLSADVILLFRKGADAIPALKLYEELSRTTERLG